MEGGIKRYSEFRLDSVQKIGYLIDLNDYVPNWIDRELYLSYYTFKEDMLEHWNAHGAPTSFDGYASMDFLWFDIDVKGNLDKAQDMTRTLVEELENKYKVPKECFALRFSGSKGFHVGIPSVCFGAYNYYRRNVPLIARAMAAEIVRVDPFDTKAQSASILDFSVYNKIRVFRADYSRHASGMYKIPISYERLMDSASAGIVKMATNKEFDPPNLSFEKTPLLVDLFQKYIDIKPEWKNVSSSITRSSHIADTNKASAFNIPSEGDRNNSLYRMAFRLFAVSNLSSNEIYDIIKSFAIASNNTSVDKITAQEVNSILRSAMAGAKTKNKIVPASFSSLMQSSEKAIRKKKVFRLNIPDIDSEVEFERGNVYRIIGKGGTKKSILCQRKIALQNSLDGVFGLFFNLEMSEKQFGSRGVKMMFSVNFEQAINTGADIEKLKQQAERMLSNNMLTVSDPIEDPRMIGEVITSIEETTERKLEYIIIDSDGMLDMKSNETKTLIKNSKEFKDLAKEKDVCLFIISHVNQSCPAHFRDCSPFVRGGGKVTDNCDGYLSVSRVLDAAKSDISSQSFIYDEDLLYFRYIDKRETGKVIDTVYRLERNTLDLIPTNQDPASFETFI